MEQAYAAIGRAVIAMQMFETTFVIIHEGVKMTTDPEYLRATGGLISETKYKTATKNVVTTLAQRGQIAPDLETRLNTLIDRRHELIHRWFLQNGWPGDDAGPEPFRAVVDLAEWVRREADTVTAMMASYYLQHAAPAALDADPKVAVKAVGELFLMLGKGAGDGQPA